MIRQRMLILLMTLALVVAGCSLPATAQPGTVAPVPTSAPAPTAMAPAPTAMAPAPSPMATAMTPAATAMTPAATAMATPAATAMAPTTTAATAAAQPMTPALFAPLPGAGIVKTASDPTLGDFLVAANGLSLYLYTRDEPNVSNCYDQCAVNWPPLLVSAGDPSATGLPGQLGTTSRQDGSTQVTYNGVPLYFWAKDAKPGDTLGQGVGNVWFVVPPAATGFPTVKTTKDATLGLILTDLEGMTLYRFTNDQGTTSTCNANCAQNWPPLLLSAGQPQLAGGVPGTLGVTARQDGSQQVTYNGMPLYYFAKDTKVGDATGQGVNDVWYVVEAKAGM